MLDKLDYHLLKAGDLAEVQQKESTRFICRKVDVIVEFPANKKYFDEDLDFYCSCDLDLDLDSTSYLFDNTKFNFAKKKFQKLFHCLNSHDNLEVQSKTTRNS